MEDDQLARQRAMDAAVAVAAAAAAHQNQEAAARRELQEQGQQQQLEQEHHHQVSLDTQPPYHNGMQVVAESGIQSNHDYPAPPPPAPVGPELKEEGSNAALTITKDERRDYEDTSMQYASDAQDQNGDTSQLGDSHNRTHTHHTKRRKINTCLPCKRRKVKCDREKPYCGECKKHNFPASECTWSAAVVDPLPNSGNQQSTTNFATSSAVSDTASAIAAGSSSGQQWYDLPGAPWASFATLPMEQSSQTLLGRIAELEAALAASKGEDTNNETRESNGQWDPHRSGLSEAAHGMAADALAMIAQHQPSATGSSASLFPTSHLSFYKAKRLLPLDSTNGPIDISPFDDQVTSGRVREIISLLPDRTIIFQLLNDFEEMQNFGLDAGISVNLVKVQLKTMEEVMDRNNFDSALILDLSFVALLLHLLAFTLEFKDVSDVLMNSGLSDKDATYSFLTENQRQDAVHEVTDLWCKASQTLLTAIEYVDRPNLNIVMALSLEGTYLRARGMTSRALATLSNALTLSTTIGLNNLGNNGSNSDNESDTLTPALRKSPIANGTFLYPLFGPLSNDQTATQEAAFWYPNESPLVQESARRVFCHLITKLRLEEPHSGIRIDHDESQSAVYPLIAEVKDLKGGYPSKSVNDSVVSSVRVTRALSDLASITVKVRNESGQNNLYKEGDAQEGKLLRDLKGIELPPTTPSNADTASLANVFQRRMVELYIEYQRLVYYRKESVVNGQCIEAAIHIIEKRLELETQTPHRYNASKILTLQQYLLETALLLCFSLLFNLGENRTKDEIRQYLRTVIPLLTLTSTRDQSRAQKVVKLIIDRSMEEQGSLANTSSLQDHLGLYENHIIIKALALSCDIDSTFWKAIHRHSVYLLSPFQV